MQKVEQFIYFLSQNYKCSNIFSTIFFFFFFPSEKLNASLAFLCKTSQKFSFQTTLQHHVLIKILGQMVSCNKDPRICKTYRFNVGRRHDEKEMKAHCKNELKIRDRVYDGTSRQAMEASPRAICKDLYRDFRR